MDLLVSFPRRYFGPARREIVRILERLGDAAPGVEKSGVPGICLAHTGLDNRDVVARCAELQRREPQAFRFAMKWVPVDYWCVKDLDAIRQLVAEQVLPRIGVEETWAMQVEKRGWSAYHKADIIARLAEAIDRKVRLKAPDKLVRIDILANVAAVSVLRPGETFSIHAASPHRLAREALARATRSG